MDIAAADEITGRVWDLTSEADVKAAWNLFYRARPRLLVASPPCTLFSCLQRARRTEMDPREWAKAVQMVELAVDMCVARAR